MLQRLIVIVFFSCIAPTLLSAQINIKAGYHLAFAQPEVNNRIISNFNEAQKSSIDKAFPSLRYLHGLEIGLRYRWEHVALEAGYLLRFRTLNATLVTATGEKPRRSLTYNYNTASVGLIGYVTKHTGVGAALELTDFRVRTRLSTEKNATSLIGQAGWSGQVFCCFDLPASRVMGVSFRPFVQWPLGEIDLRALDTGLNGSSTVAASRQRFFTYGLTVLFYNGQQVR